MRPVLSLLAPLIALVPLAGCSTAPDPLEVCSAGWIAPRAERAILRIESETSEVIDSLLSVGKAYARGDTPGPLRMLALSRDLSSLKRELTRGRGIRDLRTLASTCDDPLILASAMDRYLDRQGLPSGLRDFIAGSSIWDELTRPADETG